VTIREFDEVDPLHFPGSSAIRFSSSEAYMSVEHNRMAHASAKSLLEDLRRGAAQWTTDRLTPSTVYWQGILDWPRPDAAFQDSTTGAACAFEFKPPSQTKREYVTGLGQALTYLRFFEFSALILPSYSADGYKIAEFISAVIVEAPGGPLPIGLFSYDDDPSQLSALHALSARHGAVPGIPRGIGRQVFWAYWRDLSQYDLFYILDEMAANPSITFTSAFDKYWVRCVVAGQARKWNGTFRTTRDANAPSRAAERLNTQLSLRHLGLINAHQQLTSDGLELAMQGRVYGPGSVAFMRILANLVLVAGNHLELILWVEEQQRALPAEMKLTAENFQRGLDVQLQKAGVIRRIPGSSGKPSFLRDEQKLWNKLGFLIWADRRSYFHAGWGYVFNWRNIIGVTS
jgi:hypothetical protein